MELKILLIFSCLLVWASVEALKPPKDALRLRNLGQNAKFGPNMMSKYSKYTNEKKNFQKQLSQEIRQKLEKAPVEYRLPGGVIPISYYVEFIPYLDPSPILGREFTYDGKVKIRVRATQALTEIVMHSLFIDILQIKMTLVASGQEVTVNGMDQASDDTDFLTLFLATPLVANQEYDIEMSYSGTLDGTGFFLGLVYEGQTELGWYLSTSFQPYKARMAFPCFDEPSLKAKFTMVIAQPPDYAVVGNMPIESTFAKPEVLPDGWMFVQFKESLVMSTYLVAFTVAKFEQLVSPSDNRFSVWAQPGRVQHGTYANEISPKVLKFYEDYTQTDYKAPKVDQLAYEEYYAGAMENWGHVSYRENLLLFDPSVDTTYDQQFMATAVSHELTHQWFGNLVSPAWWSDLWLNEGFATYYEYFGMQSVGSDWEVEQQFVVDLMHLVFVSDTFASIHPVHSEVDTPDSIDAIFDNISYLKGACLVRFMINLMGEDNFKQAIKIYLDDHAFNSVRQENLFASLEPFVPAGILPTGETLAEVMDTWTLQAGVPILTVTRDYQARTALISQKRFGVSGTEIWSVPLTFATQSEANFEDLTPKYWLLTQSAEIEAPSENEWIILNLRQTGYYRVNYDLENWGLIASFFSSEDNVKKVHPVNRAQLINDAVLLSFKGELDYTTALTTTKYLSLETDIGPWTAALLGIEYIRDRMYQSLETTALFDNYWSSRLSNVFNNVSGLNVNSNDPHFTKMTRILVSNWACNTGLDQCNQEGFAKTKEWQDTINPDKNNPIEPDVRDAAYCAGVRLGTMADYNFILSRYANAEDYDEQGRLLGAMGCASDPAILQEFLSEILKDDSSLLPGDAIGVFYSVYANPIGIELALDFLIENFLQLVDVMDIGDAFYSISEKLNTQVHYAKIQGFLDDNEADLTDDEYQLIIFALEILSATLEWNAANFENVKLYFAANQ